MPQGSFEKAAFIQPFMILHGCEGEAWTPHVAIVGMRAGTRFSFSFHYVGSSSSEGLISLEGVLSFKPLDFPSLCQRLLHAPHLHFQATPENGGMLDQTQSHTSVPCSPNSMGFSFMPLQMFIRFLAQVTYDLVDTQ